VTATKSVFTWKDAFSNLGASDILLLIFDHLDLVSLINTFFVNKAWSSSISANVQLKSKLTYSETFLGLYRVEKSLVATCSIGNSKYKETMPFCSFRRILVDWLIDVQGEYKLSMETFHTSVLLLDRCLFHFDDVPPNKLQLLGITCLFVASKFCEIVHPLLTDMIWVCDNTYTREQHVSMELKVMQLLSFQVYTITPAAYIMALKESLREDSKLQMLAFYIADLSLVDGNSVGLASSLIAASSVALALQILEREERLDLIAQLCRTTPLEVRRNMCRLQRLHVDDYDAFGPHGTCVEGSLVHTASKQLLRAVHDRYSHEQCQGVSSIHPMRERIVRNLGVSCDDLRDRCWRCQMASCAKLTMSLRQRYDVTIQTGPGPSDSGVRWTEVDECHASGPFPVCEINGFER
jgi:hypothetical protein